FCLGCKDYFSLLVQAVVLPVLGLITFFWPRIGYKLLYDLRSRCDAPRQFSDVIYYTEEDTNDAKPSTRQRITESIMGILGCISAFVHMVTLFIEQILSLCCGDACTTFSEGLRLTVISPFAATGCLDSKEVYRAHRIAKESFNPSSLA